ATPRRAGAADRPTGPSVRPGRGAPAPGCAPGAGSRWPRPTRPPKRRSRRSRPPASRPPTRRPRRRVHAAGAAAGPRRPTRHRASTPRPAKIDSVTDLDERPDELQRYVASMRRQRVWYLAVIAVLAVIALAVTLVVWFSGEITHVHLRTARSAPPSVPAGTPPATPTARW